MIVDVHAHCYPKEYVKELGKIGMGDAGRIGIKIPEWSSAQERIERMDSVGIDVQVLSLSSPNVYFPDAELSRDLARMTNELIAGVCKEYPDRFLSFASVPLNNMDYALAELNRAINQLGMDGVVLGTNVNQKSLSEDRFLPFFEEIDKMKVPVALHPMRGIAEDLMPPEDEELTIPSLVGFLFETTRTIAQFIFKGVLEKYKNLTFILPHSGGAIPFVYPRWDMMYSGRPAGHPMRKVPNMPSHYLKRHYYDTALAYYPTQLRSTLDLAGADHVVFGTDTPYTIYDSRAGETIEKIKAYDLPAQEKEKIFSGNAATIFPKLNKKMSPEAKR